jgi:tetratricopeptide (TPR) repeat protein
MSTERKDFFISYNHKDKQWAEWIAWQLDVAGYSVVFQTWDFRPGGNFVIEMHKATVETERTIVVLSESFLGSEFTQPEWAAAFAQDPTGARRRLVPIRIEKCEPTGLLAQIVFLDLVDLDEAEACQLLLDGLKAIGKPKVKPVFPNQKFTGHTPAFPGLPAIWNIPIPRNPNFTGREKQLDLLQKALHSGQPAALTQAIHCMGGVGKTQIAAEYAYRQSGQYDVVWWIRSEETATLAGDYAALADKLILPQAGAQNQQETIDAVREWLRIHEKWLLIFDNANESKEISPYLPPSKKGHVLITSRNKVWKGTAQPVDVEVLPSNEAVQFILQRTRKQDDKTAKELAKELGYLPLALEQAGAYIEATGISLSEYLKLYLETGVSIFEEEESAADQHMETVARTWKISSDRIFPICPEAIELLNLCAYFAPDGIPKTLIVDGAELLPSHLVSVVGDQKRFNHLVMMLRSNGLLGLKSDALTIHRSLQVIIRERQNANQKKEWATAAIEIINKFYPFDSDDVRFSRFSERLLPHALATIGHAEALSIAHETTIRLLNLCANYLKMRGTFSDAKVLLNRSLQIAESVYGSQDPATAIIMNNLGGVCRDLGCYVDAEKYFRRSLDIAKKTYDYDHTQVATYINNLGSVLQDLGNYKEARECYERALEIDEAFYGPNHPKVAIRVNNLGGVLRALGDLTEVQRCFERALKIDELNYGIDHPAVATDINNLGLVFQDMGRLRESEKCFKRALAIEEAAYGPDHPSVAIYFNNLGLVLGDLGEAVEARRCIERALRIFEKYLGQDHPSTKVVQENFRNICSQSVLSHISEKRL